MLSLCSMKRYFDYSGNFLGYSDVAKVVLLDVLEMVGGDFCELHPIKDFHTCSAIMGFSWSR